MQRESELRLASNDEFNALLNSILEQATLFLEEIGSFYPFGTTVSSTGTVIPLGVYIDNEMDSSEVPILLGKAIDEKFKRSEIIAAAIAADVNFKTSPNDEPSRAIQIKLSHLIEEPLDYYLIYSIIGRKCSIEKCLFYPGSN